MDERQSEAPDGYFGLGGASASWRAIFLDSRFIPENSECLNGCEVSVLETGLCVAPSWCGHGSTFSWDVNCGWWVETNFESGDVCVWERIPRYTPPAEQAAAAKVLDSYAKVPQVPPPGKSSLETLNLPVELPRSPAAPSSSFAFRPPARVAASPSLLRESRALVRCKQGHPLARKTESTDWICDAADEPGGCRSGGGPFLGSIGGGPARYRCRDCDYDLCGLCYTAWGMSQTTPETKNPGTAPLPETPKNGAAASSARVSVFDFSFPVEIQDGRRLQIEWNRQDDPQRIAQDFAHMHQIPADELQSISDFILFAQASSPSSASENTCSQVTKDDSCSGDAADQRAAQDVTVSTSKAEDAEYPWAAVVQDFLPDLQEDGDGFTYSLDRTQSGEYWNVLCPHCEGWFRVKSTEVNCAMFRHAVRVDNFEILPPHSSRATCEELLAAGLIYGCGKPVRFDPKKWKEGVDAVVTTGEYTD